MEVFFIPGRAETEEAYSWPQDWEFLEVLWKLGDCQIWNSSFNNPSVGLVPLNKGFMKQIGNFKYYR